MWSRSCSAASGPLISSLFSLIATLHNCKNEGGGRREEGGERREERGERREERGETGREEGRVILGNFFNGLFEDTNRD